VGGPFASMPMYTLTTRKGSPDRLELRYAERDSQITLKRTDLLPLLGTWLEVTEAIEYGTSGVYSIEINRVSDGTVLFEYSNNDMVNWRQDAEFVRPKWGIYRSLNNPQDLRDENVLFANFSVEEVETLSADTSSFKRDFYILSNATQRNLILKNVPDGADLVRVYTLDGKKVWEKKISKSEELLDISLISEGIYIIRVSSKTINVSKLIVIS
jgi:hypothetical protein